MGHTAVWFGFAPKDCRCDHLQVVSSFSLHRTYLGSHRLVGGDEALRDAELSRGGGGRAVRARAASGGDLRSGKKRGRKSD